MNDLIRHLAACRTGDPDFSLQLGPLRKTNGSDLGWKAAMGLQVPRSASFAVHLAERTDEDFNATQVFRVGSSASVKVARRRPVHPHIAAGRGTLAFTGRPSQSLPHDQIPGYAAAGDHPEPAMDIEKTLAIVQALAEGRDPVSGNPLAATDVCQQPDVIRALMHTCEIVEIAARVRCKDPASRCRSTPANRGPTTRTARCSSAFGPAPALPTWRRCTPAPRVRSAPVSRNSGN